MPNERGRTGLSENHLGQINFSTQILCYTFVATFVILRLSLQRTLGKPFSFDDGMSLMNDWNRPITYI
jgi:hypothetical protein